MSKTVYTKRMVRLAEYVIGAVTVVWVISFVADIVMDTYSAEQINNIFIAVVANGIFLRVLAAGSLPDHDDNEIKEADG